jgi:flagellar basal-body rod protein FlgC
MADPLGGIRGPRLRPVEPFLGTLAPSASGMSAFQKSLEAISSNIANAETTRTPEGGPYRRQVVVMRPDGKGGVEVARVVEDAREGREEFIPGHPDADANGMVKMPNVDLATETVDLVIARRMHEANVTVFQAAKAMLHQALDI